MNMLKIAAAAALVAASLSASAMTTIADEELSQVAGQDGVSIAANLNINIGSFTYTDTDTNGGSVHFNNITVTGLVAMTVDVLNNATAAATIGGAISAYDTAASASTATITSDLAAASTFLGTSDAVQFAFPALGVSHASSPTITVGSVTLNTAASFGSFQIKNLDLQGTTVLMWAH